MSRITLLSRLWKHKIFRFVCVGIMNTLTDLTILNILVFAFNLKLLVANCISASISIMLSYFWNHSLVFQKQHKRSLRLFAKFVIVTGLSILAVQSVIIFSVEHALTVRHIAALTHFSTHISKFVQVNGAKMVAVLGGMVWNFVLYHLVVFKEAPKSGEDQESVMPY